MGEAGFAAFGRNGLWFTPEPGLNADRAQSLRRRAHRGCRLFVHTARQDQEALAARLEKTTRPKEDALMRSGSGRIFA